MDIKLNAILNFSVAFNQASVCSRLSALLKRIARSVSSLFATKQVNNVTASSVHLIKSVDKPTAPFTADELIRLKLLLDAARTILIHRRAYEAQVAHKLNTKVTRSEIKNAYTTASFYYNLLPKNKILNKIMAHSDCLANTLIIEV